MELLERFLNYVKIDTMSDDTTGLTPSTNKQYVLANKLHDELEALGLTALVNDKCTVYATLKANKEGMDKIGLLAHMDTIPEVSGTNVKPQVIENYTGGIIKLGNGEVLDPNQFEALKKEIGHTIVTTSGDTVLGCDDKGGIAVIMTVLEEIIKENLPHGEIHVAFTPDEEIGTGILSFDTDLFPVDYAYTIDGEEYEEFSYENFNASSATVKIKGFEIHPGAAKGKMINAAKVAMEFASLLPQAECPEYTDGYDGFNHLTEIKGNTSEATMHYILRNHDSSKLKKQKQDFVNAYSFINKKYGEGTCILDITDSYRNMREIIDNDMRSVNKALKAYHEEGIDVKVVPTRGGTDGARLTFMGICTPNIGTGGYNCHGIHEYADITEMDKIVSLVKRILTTK